MEEETVKVEYIILENGRKYYIANEKEGYVLLVNADDELDYCIRKNVERDGKEYIETLDSDAEFEKAEAIFFKE